MSFLRHALEEERHELIAAAQAGAQAPDGLTRIVERNIAMRAFLLRLLNPEDLGQVVDEALRDEVHTVLGIPHVGAK